MKIIELDGFNMIERDHEDLYIDRDWWDDYDYLSEKDDFDDGWYEDDYDYLDEDLDDYSYDPEH